MTSQEFQQFIRIYYPSSPLALAVALAQDLVDLTKEAAAIGYSLEELMVLAIENPAA